MRRTNMPSTMSTTMLRPWGARAAVTIVAAGLIGSITAGCGGSEAANPVAEAAASAAPAYGLVTSREATALAASGVTVIDVRTPEEFAEGHIEGAQLIDFYSATFERQIAALDPDGEYLVYCRSGNRSGQTIALMERYGIDQVWDLRGGVLAGDLPLVP